MDNQDRVLAYLKAISPEDATNADIRSGTGVSPHQQVFQITQSLMKGGLIRGRQFGKEWRFVWIAPKIEGDERQPS
jgi:hypothetical protein